MSRATHLICSIALVALATGSARAATYYVRTDGSDLNAGVANTAADALRTVQAAADRTVAGDVVLVQAGDYAESVTLRRAGAPGVPITFRAEGVVRLGNVTFPSSGVFSQGISWNVVLDGFVFDGAITGAASGIDMWGAGDVQVLNCAFRNYVTEPGVSWPQRAGIAFWNNAWTGQWYITVRDCVFEGNTFGVWSPGSGMLNSSSFQSCRFVGNTYGYLAQNWGDRYNTFSDCVFDRNVYGAVLQGVYWYWLKTTGNVFRRSVFSNNTIGLSLGDLDANGYQSSTYANTIVNCDFFGNAEAGLKVNTNFADVTRNGDSPAWYEAQGNTVTNTIFLANGVGADNWQNKVLFSTYNLAWGNTLDGRNVGFDASTSSLSVDPLLVNPGAGDLRPAYGSPVIDAGNPAYDSDPVVVGAHVDIGAFEYRDPTPADVLAALIKLTATVPESYLKNKNNSVALSAKFYAVWDLVQQGDRAATVAEKRTFYNGALQKVRSDVIAKTDGCAKSGAPDKNDWVTSCAVQADFYGPAKSLEAMLVALLATL